MFCTLYKSAAYFKGLNKVQVLEVVHLCRTFCGGKYTNWVVRRNLYYDNSGLDVIYRCFLFPITLHKSRLLNLELV